MFNRRYPRQVYPLMILLSLLITGIRSGEMETRVINYLFNGSYNTEARPAIKETDSVVVEFEIAYTQLVDMDEKLQTLKSSIWVRQKWSDCRLTWNATEYGDVSSIHISPELIWKPDIVLYNSIDDKGEMYKFTTKASISSNGTIMWLSPVVVTTSCPINIRHFPFDSQICTLTFGSWTYDGNKLDLQFLGDSSADLASYSGSGEWDLLSVNAVRNVKSYTCCHAPYYDLTYNIALRRLTLYYAFYLILPCIVLASVVAMSFLFPQESGQRLSLVITVMLGMTVFMLIITNNIPPTSLVVPLIGKFFTALLIEIAIALFMTGLTLELHYASPKREIPGWLKILIFKILGSVFSLKRNHKSYNVKTESLEYRNTFIDGFKDGHQSNGSVENGNGMVQCRENTTSVELKDDIKKGSNSINEASPSARDKTTAINEQVATISEGVAKLCQAQETKVEDNHRREEWQEAARILDRFFFTLSLLTVIITVLVAYGGQ